jgi:UDP-N-acetylmuramoyl-L-alanyl-D-glutamate--2,6-diaminopimelate ligase
MDPAAAAIAAPGRQRWTFGLGDGYDICALEPTFDLQGCRAELRSPHGPASLELQLLGRHNLENALGALGAALAVGLPLDQAVAGLCALRAVPGRLEAVPGPPGLTVLVDYAHSPDALERVLATLRPLCQGRVLTVFGCGGDRDAGKRPLMGAAASAGSDLVYLTSDNPRSEDPQAIIGDILPGLRGEHRVEPLRERAIGAAIAEARRGDVVLIAGKGHESTQTIGDRVYPFDDRLVAAAALAGWKEQ